MASFADDRVRELDTEPESADLRVRAARALALEARYEEAHGVLGRAFENLVAHDAGPPAPGGGAPAFPCLCKRCIEPALGSTAAGGLELTRDFVVSSGRVLYFWVPEGLRGEIEGVRAAVQKELDGRLSKKRWVPTKSNPSYVSDADAGEDAFDGEDDEDEDSDE